MNRTHRLNWIKRVKARNREVLAFLQVTGQKDFVRKVSINYDDFYYKDRKMRRIPDGR